MARHYAERKTNGRIAVFRAQSKQNCRGSSIRARQVAGEPDVEVSVSPDRGTETSALSLIVEVE